MNMDSNRYGAACLTHAPPTGHQVNFTFTGTLSDVDLLENSNKAEFATDAESQESMEFWYTDERLKASASSELLGPIDVVALNVATKRGELRLAGRGAKVRAFIKKVCLFLACRDVFKNVPRYGV